MSAPDQIEFSPAEAAPPFPVPKWARVTAYVGLYVLVLAGMSQIEQSIVALLDILGVEGASLHEFGLLAGLYVGIMGLPSLLYRPGTDPKEGLYDTACSLVSIVLAFVAAIVTLVAMRIMAPDFAVTLYGDTAPFLAGCGMLAIGAGITFIATRRRRRMAEEVAAETEGSEG